MPAELEFRGDFPVTPKRMMGPGDWYLGFRCVGCGNRFAILDDPTGTGGMLTTGDALFKAQCPGCGADGAYPTEALLTFQATTGGMTLPE